MHAVVTEMWCVAGWRHGGMARLVHHVMFKLNELKRESDTLFICSRCDMQKEQSPHEVFFGTGEANLYCFTPATHFLFYLENVISGFCTCDWFLYLNKFLKKVSKWVLLTIYLYIV